MPEKSAMPDTRRMVRLRLRSLLTDVQNPDLLLIDILPSVLVPCVLRFAARHLMIWWHQYKSW